MACLRPWNAPLDPRRPCFGSLKVVPFASPPPAVYMQRLNALWCRRPCSLRWLFWWSYRRRRRTYRESPVLVSTSVMSTNQAAASPPATNALKILRHRLGSEPPAGLEDEHLLHADARIIFTFGSSATIFFDSVFNPFKPTHVVAPPLHCIHASPTPLLQLAGGLPRCASSSQDEVAKCLHVTYKLEFSSNFKYLVGMSYKESIKLRLFTK